MHPDGFEQLTTALLYKYGYLDVHNIGGSGDRGRDILAHKPKHVLGNLVTDETWIVICKRYVASPPTPAALESDMAWATAHSPDGVMIVFPHKMTSGTHDWIRDYGSRYKFEIKPVDIDFLNNELETDSHLRNRFFPPPSLAKEEAVIVNTGWYERLIQPRTELLTIYTAGKMPAEPTRGAQMKWRIDLEHEARKVRSEIAFFHPEFIGCDHTGVNADETVASDAAMIRRADAIVAYLDQDELYGTITELLVAHQQFKDIAVFIDEEILYSDEGKRDTAKLYEEAYRTRHGCTCMMHSSSRNELLETNKYWFALTFLDINSANFHVYKVNRGNVVQKMVEQITAWYDQTAAFSTTEDEEESSPPADLVEGKPKMRSLGDF